MIVTVRGQGFEIGFVNNYCREQYQEMLEAAEELTALPERIEAAQTREEIKAVRQDQKAVVQKIGELREDILHELLVTNGHEYDKHWWLHKTDIDDINRFVVESIQKDLKGSGSKKK